jgi:HK97 family phage portal protein
MGFIQKLFGRKSAEVLDTPEKIAAAIGYGADSYTGKTISSQRAMQVSTVFGCVRVLSESVGMLPCKLYEQTGGVRSSAVNHSLYRLLTVAPNGYMTAQEFWELLTACLCLRGNFYAYKVIAFDNVTELLPIDPSAIKPKLVDHKAVYEVTWKNGKKEELDQDKIWHVRTLTLDGLNGLNPIAYAREAISLSLATEEHGAKLFKNGAVTSGVLSTADKLTDDAFNRLKTQFSENYEGLTNAHKPMILEMGLDWKPISLNLEDSQFLETRKFQRDEICAIFRVPPHLVANLDNATFSNIENLGLGFVNYSLIPYLTRIESRINIGLVRRNEQGKFYAKFNTGALLRGDIKSRYESYGTGINWGILSPNDCRDLEDLNPRQGGDIYLTPLNMTTNPEANTTNNSEAENEN